MTDFVDDFDELFGQVVDEDGLDDRENGGAARRYSSKSGLMIVVDCSRQMFVKDKDGATPFQAAMDVAFLTLKRRVVTDGASGSQVGLVFYNTKDTKNENGFENVYTLHSLGGIVVDRIKEVRLLASSSECAKFAEAHCGPAPLPDDCPLERALWLCNFAFSTAKFTKQDDQKVWLFTNNDNPFFDSDAAKVKLQKRMEDLFQAGQRVFLWPLVHDSSEFDENRFFRQAFAAQQLENETDLEVEQEEEPIIWVTAKARDNMAEFVKKKDFPKRRLAPMQIDLGNDVSFSVDLYPLFMRASVPTKEKIDARTNSILRTDTKYICKDTLTILTPDQILAYFPYGVKNRVKVVPEELVMLKDFGPAHHFTLLGFKDRDLLKPWHSVRSSYFVVPTEKPIRGSTKLFAALLDSLLCRKYIMICSGVLRRSEPVKLFAFMPRPERVNEDDETLVDPAGFDVVVLPWANDIRNLKPSALSSGSLEGGSNGAKKAGDGDNEAPAPPQAPADADMVEKAKALINKMRLPAHEETGRFEPFENPAIDKHFTVLEWAVLDGEGEIDWDEHEDDTTKLRDEDLGKSVRKLGTAFNEAYGGLEDEEAYKENEKERKRKMAAANKAAAGPPKKRARKAPADGDADGPPADWRDKLEKGTLSKLTIPVLKLILEDLGLSQTGKKAELVARIEESAGVKTEQE
ncbi:ATP-dependent DNA helicase II subunit 1 [Hondaea fermentalgiana]|uniref:ATP-dependent DNA helicase II subunit 1 n=1 Tax=Hondaea fermentalgiana TaxID=2315210 RepID=A0A2R5G415_9STRA|nr:ATP-dependent DNA helicase II subunit 1 [Hondaea fermentalgiana]|eukprot:GBG24518.1 ATP-dependent DNA helicase II subunit 1 [Hondaea fermentalgiana]